MSDVRSELAEPPGSPWDRINQVFDVADALVALKELRMEGGVPEDEAMEWAKEKLGIKANTQSDLRE